MTGAGYVTVTFVLLFWSSTQMVMVWTPYPWGVPQNNLSIVADIWYTETLEQGLEQKIKIKVNLERMKDNLIKKTINYKFLIMTMIILHEFECSPWVHY